MSEGVESITKPRSDLGVRTLSGIAMMLVATVAILIGGWIFRIFVILVAVGLLREWFRLAWQLRSDGFGRLLWAAGGIVYIGFATANLVALREISEMYLVLTVIGIVIATDTGAYFAGRTFGGPKIAPKISPSKTWSGLAGGMLAAAILASAVGSHFEAFAIWQPLVGAGLAVVAQAGDFFESWMKRRAGVKDSGSLIPGHGGLLDRADGLLAVLFAVAILLAVVHFDAGVWRLS